MSHAAITAVDYHLPDGRLTNEELASAFPEWPAERIERKLGIRERRVAAPDETSGDLAFAAASKLIGEVGLERNSVDYLLLCTQSPDYFLPTTACVLQDRLGLPRSTGALDFNLGCSGFVYGLGLAKGLIESGQARKVLLLTAETYSKFIHPSDKSVKTIFGDAAAATLIEAVDDRAAADRPWIGPFEYGTDGRGAQNLVVGAGGMRERATVVASADSSADDLESSRSSFLYMNGTEIFTFTGEVVPTAARNLLEQGRTSMDEVDLFVFHQANIYMLDHLRRKLRIPSEKMVVAMEHSGNTVSATIPIALKHAVDGGQLTSGMQVMVMGFGVGYSWAGALLQWR